MPEEQRTEAEVKFKKVSEAYDILYDEDKRQRYDQFGMSAFDPSQRPFGPGGGADMDDILSQMFGFSMGGGAGGAFPGMGGMKNGEKRKGPDEMKSYEVTLEELYRGKTVKFASTKNVMCPTCEGSGGKDKAKPSQCSVCGGKGSVTGLRQIAPGFVTQSTMPCVNCEGSGRVFKDKDKCKKCKGKRVVQTKKMLELYIPPGAREGERIVLAGEADQHPDMEPGDVVFVLEEKKHEVFHRAGADLMANLEVTLAEALTGFDRVIVKHLDGRGIQMKFPQKPGEILRPDQVMKIPGEGMPFKRSDSKGDLYLVVKIEFPPDGWAQDEAMVKKIRDVLPGPEPPIEADVVDEVGYTQDAELEDFGAGSGDPRAGAEWQDDDDEDHIHEGPQCAQQ